MRLPKTTPPMVHSDWFLCLVCLSAGHGNQLHHRLFLPSFSFSSLFFFPSNRPNHRVGYYSFIFYYYYYYYYDFLIVVFLYFFP